MKRVLSMAAALVLAGPLVTAAHAQQTDRRIAEAVQILPTDLRAGATVVTYDKATGDRQVLRQGTNFVECQPRMDDGFTRCYNKALGPRRDLEAKLRAQKKSDKEVTDAVQAALKDGTLKPPPPAMFSYRGYDKRDRIQNLWVVSLPDRKSTRLNSSHGMSSRMPSSA